MVIDSSFKDNENYKGTVIDDHNNYCFSVNCIKQNEICNGFGSISISWRRKQTFYTYRNILYTN